MDAYMVRDVTFIVVQFYACATLHLSTQASRLALLASVLAGAFLSLIVSEWTPTIFSAIIIPVLLGALPGLVLGEILLTVFDRFAAQHEVEVQLPSRGRALMCCQSTEIMRVAPVTLVAGVLAQLLLFILPLSVTSTALQWVVFLYASILLVLNMTVALVLRRFNAIYARAWLIFGMLNVVGCTCIMTTIAFGTTFWSLIVYACVAVLTMLASFAVAPFTSNDVREAMESMTQTMSQPIPSVSSIPLVPVHKAPMPSLSSSHQHHHHQQQQQQQQQGLNFGQPHVGENTVDKNSDAVLNYFNSFNFSK
jgi:hypothetical protein